MHLCIRIDRRYFIARSLDSKGLSNLAIKNISDLLTIRPLRSSCNDLHKELNPDVLLCVCIFCCMHFNVKHTRLTVVMNPK